MHRTITGFSNPTVKFLRSLRDKKHRRREKRFLAEGLRLLTDARESGKLPEMLVMATRREPHPLLETLAADVAAAGGEVVEMDEDILAKVTGKDNPQAVAGVFAEFDTQLAGLDRAAAPIWLVAQALRDPGNLGTMLRTGDAVGAGGLILIDDCTDPFSVEAVRASMGAVFTPAGRAGRGGLNSSPGCETASTTMAVSSSRRRCAMPPIIGTRPMPRHASLWSATKRAACRRSTRTPATCGSPCRCAAARIASMPQWRARSSPMRRWRIWCRVGSHRRTRAEAGSIPRPGSR